MAIVYLELCVYVLNAAVLLMLFATVLIGLVLKLFLPKFKLN